MECTARCVGVALAALLAACGDRSTTPSAQSGFVLDGAGRPLHTLTIGSGPDTVLVLAGGPGVPAAYLEPLMRDLAAARTLIAVEPRGTGESGAVPLLPDSVTLALQVDDVMIVIDSLRIGRMSILAHHAGALLAERVARRLPERVERLALVAPLYPRAKYQYSIRRDTAGLAPSPDLSRLYDSSVHRVDPVRFCREAWPVFFGPATYWEPEARAAIADALCAVSPPALARVLDVKRHMTTALGDWEWRDSLRLVRQPTLVVQGTRLDPAYVHGARNWARYLPAGRIVELAAHPLMPWTDARLPLVRSLNEFLSGTMPSRAAVPPLVDVVGPEDSVPPPEATLEEMRRAQAIARTRVARRAT